MNNYRPISILPTLSKIIEKWIATKLMSYLNKCQLLHKNQSGFCKNHSTESALILMTGTWLKYINKGKLVGCAMIDLEKPSTWLIINYFLTYWIFVGSVLQV